MRTKKILLSILYFFLCFLTILSSSIVFSYQFVRTNEIVGAYAHEGSRIDVYFSDEKTPYEFIQSNRDYLQANVDDNIIKHTKVYQESTYTDVNKPIIIGDYKTKVLISDSSNRNYFNLNMVKGELPDADKFVVSEEIADFYGLFDKELPAKIDYDYILNGVKLSSTLTVSGIYKNDNNKYINKPDSKGNDCSKYTIVGVDSINIKNHFAEFIEIIEFLRSDKISNSFVLAKIFEGTSGVLNYLAYDDFLSDKPNDNFKFAIYNQRNGKVDASLLVNLTPIFIPIGIVSFILMTALSVLLLKKYFPEIRKKINNFHLCFFSSTISLLIIFLVYSLNLNGKILFIGSMFAGITNLITINLIFITLLIISILITRNAEILNTEKQIQKYESSPEGLVSIIIPSYNGSKYLKYAIDSALNQTYKNIEVIVVNDGSTDNGLTDQLVSEYVKNKQIKYFKKENGGVSSALNYGISKSSGKFINWLSHDDMLSKDSVRVRLGLFAHLNDPKKLVYSNINFMNENGEIINRVAAKTRDINSYSRILKSNINGCSLILPREIFDEHKFKENMRFMQDYYFWCDLIKDGYVMVRSFNKTVLSRVHSEQVTLKRGDLREQDFAIVFNDYIRPLYETKDYFELRRIMLLLQRRVKLHGFYHQYIEEIRNYLKQEKKLDGWDKLELSFNKLFSSMVVKARKILK